MKAHPILFMAELKNKIKAPQLSLNYSLCLLLLLLSCEYNIHDFPGMQVSMNSSISKKHDAFICSYTHPLSINGVEIKEIFTEKQYYLERGLFADYLVNDTISQIVIVTKYPIGDEHDKVWNFKGFEYAGRYGQHKKLEKKGIDYPDSLSIDIISLEDSSVLETMVLHKIKEKEVEK